jgi:hypothetical protein
MSHEAPTSRAKLPMQVCDPVQSAVRQQGAPLDEHVPGPR